MAAAKSASLTSQESRAASPSEWRDLELPTNDTRLSFTRLLFAHIGGACALFLATSDATIISTALPTIAKELRATPSQYNWVGVAYLLAMTAMQPVYGHLADTWGRKPVLGISIGIFTAGSTCTGTAQSIDMLIFARALSGVGAGGIVSSVWVMLSEIVVPSKRAVWSIALTVTWCASAIAGPLLGGLFSGTERGVLSWRVAFLMNVPISACACGILFLALRSVQLQERPKYATWRALGRHLRASFDFVGLVLLIGGSVSVLVGFSCASATGWKSMATIATFVIGVASLAAGAIYECWTPRDALIPASVFTSRASGAVLIAQFFLTLAFNAGTFYLAVYYQAVLGASPLRAGILVLPYSLGSSLVSAPVAFVIDRVQRGPGKTTLGAKFAFVGGLAIACLGFGLMTLMDSPSTKYSRTLYPLVAGLGIGMTFHSPYQIISNAMDPELLAPTTGAFFLVRFLASTTGVSVAGVIFDTELRQQLPAALSADRVVSNLRSLIQIEDPELRAAALGAVARSIAVIWSVCWPLLALACFVSLFIPVQNVRQEAEPPVAPCKPRLSESIGPKDGFDADIEKTLSALDSTAPAEQITDEKRP